MKTDLVLITPDISFGDLQLGKVTPTQVYRSQTKVLILNPVDALEHQKPFLPGNGMAAFAVLLMFFEPHGQYLLGIDGNSKSKRCFCSGFERFRDSLPVESIGVSPRPEDFYVWARCGLFHSNKLSNKMLVDTINSGSGIFTKNERVSAVLINPWRLKKHLNDYI